MKLVNFDRLFVNHTDGPSWRNHLPLQDSVQPLVSILSFMQFVQEIAFKKWIKIDASST